MGQSTKKRWKQKFAFRFRAQKSADRCGYGQHILCMCLCSGNVLSYNTQCPLTLASESAGSPHSPRFSIRPRKDGRWAVLFTSFFRLEFDVSIFFSSPPTLHPNPCPSSKLRPPIQNQAPHPNSGPSSKLRPLIETHRLHPNSGLSSKLRPLM